MKKLVKGLSQLPKVTEPLKDSDDKKEFSETEKTEATTVGGELTAKPESTDEVPKQPKLSQQKKREKTRGAAKGLTTDTEAHNSGIEIA